MRILVVGTGSIGRRHIRNLISMGMDDIAGCENHPKRSEQVKKESFKLRFGLMAKNFGIDFHAIIKGRKYRKKLARALEEKGLPAQ